MRRAAIAKGVIEALAAALAQARQRNQDPWQFALELDELIARGAGRLELRALVADGLVEHRREVTTLTCIARCFEPLASLVMPPGTCFVLSAAGEVAYGAGRRGRSEQGANGRNGFAAAVRPRWDGQRRELSLAGRVIKRFRVPAGNQEAILAAFESAGWPHCIADPLAAVHEQEPRQRLGYAIKALNRRQRRPALRFHGDGTGRRVCWSLVEAAARKVADRTRSGP